MMVHHWMRSPNDAAQDEDNRYEQRRAAYALVVALAVSSSVLQAQTPVPVVGSNGATQDATIKAAESYFWKIYHAGEYQKIDQALHELELGQQHAEDLWAAAKTDDERTQATAYEALMLARAGWLHLWRASEYKLIPVGAGQAFKDTEQSQESFYLADNKLASFLSLSSEGPLLRSFNAWQPTLHMAVEGFRAASAYAYGRALIAEGVSLVEEGYVAKTSTSVIKGATELQIGKVLLDKSIIDYPAFNGYTHAAVTQTGVADLQQNLVALLGILKGCADTIYHEEFGPFVDFVKRSEKRLPTAAVTPIPKDVAHLCVNTDRVPHNFEGQMMALGDLMFMAEGQADYKLRKQDVVDAWNLATTDSYSSWPESVYLQRRQKLLRADEFAVPKTLPDVPSLPDLNNCQESAKACQADRVKLLRTLSFEAPGCLVCHKEDASSKSGG